MSRPLRIARPWQLAIITTVAVVFALVVTPPRVVHANSLSYYYLPWAAGQSHYVTQGNNNPSGSHNGLYAWAWDFGGDAWVVYSARAGYVSWEKDTYGAGGCNQQLYQNLVNYVVIRSTNSDGSSVEAQYIHLLKGSASSRVSLNAAIPAGVPIGVTDSSGWVCPDPVPNGAHLHYMVQQVCVTNWNCQSITSSFIDVGVPQANTWVTSGNVVVAGLGPVDGLHGDVRGSGLVDLVSINDSQVFVMRSSGSSFINPPDVWWSWGTPSNYVPPYGTRATLLGDVTGSGKADLVLVNENDIRVMVSTGTAFGDPQKWSTGADAPFYGSRATLLADIRGIGRLDLVAVNDTSVWVALSTGTSFATPTQWWSSNTVHPYGSKATLLQDVNGDGKADVIGVNSNGQQVMTSTGSGFLDPASWSSTPFYGDKWTLAGDVSNDGKADLVAVNNSSTWVMTSNSSGSGFNAPALWASQPFYGNRATFLGHIEFIQFHYPNDLVAVNDSNVWVMTDTGSTFNPPALWSSILFYGTRATI